MREMWRGVNIKSSKIIVVRRLNDNGNVERLAIEGNFHSRQSHPQ